MTKKTIIVAIALAVAALHFITGEHYQGPLPGFVNGYLIDILLPMELFLLLDLIRTPWIHSILFRASAVFGFGCIVEASQYLGHPIFGSTPDPLDVLAYAGGVIIGIVLDTLVLSHLAPAEGPSPSGEIRK